MSSETYVQDGMLDVEAPAAKKAKRDDRVSCADLRRSLNACYRVENAIWRQLEDLGITERTRRYQLFHALSDVRVQVPEWCTPDAWKKIADSMRSWAETFGDLQRYWTLRKEPAPPYDHQQGETDVTADDYS